MVWNVSMILSNVWLRNARFKNLLITSVEQHFRSTILKFDWLFLFGFSQQVICYLGYSNWCKYETSVTLKANSKAYFEPCQSSKMEVFIKIVNGFSFLIIFAKSFMKLDQASKSFIKLVKSRYLTRSWVRLWIQ